MRIDGGVDLLWLWVFVCCEEVVVVFGDCGVGAADFLGAIVGEGFDQVVFSNGLKVVRVL